MRVMKHHRYARVTTIAIRISNFVTRNKVSAVAPGFAGKDRCLAMSYQTVLYYNAFQIIIWLYFVCVAILTKNMIW